LGEQGGWGAEPNASQLAPEQVGSFAAQLAPEQVASLPVQLPAARIESPATQPAARPVTPTPARVAPLSPGRFVLQVTVDQETREQLRYAQALLGHSVPAGDVAEVLKRALNLLVGDLEKKRFAKCARSASRRTSANPRYVPADVRRTVWQRDGGKCTFESSAGKRCEEQRRLEFDHIEPLARGGRTIASNLRLRCRTHNQYEAECAFGSDFMRGKRD